MIDVPLFADPPVAIQCSMLLVHGEGWHLKVAAKPENGSRGFAEWTHYDSLTAAELLDTLAAHLHTTLYGS